MDATVCHVSNNLDYVRELFRGRMDVLARRFHETKDLKISDEIYRLAGELVKLEEPWRFVVISNT